MSLKMHARDIGWDSFHHVPRRACPRHQSALVLALLAGEAGPVAGGGGAAAAAGDGVGAGADRVVELHHVKDGKH